MTDTAYETPISELAARAIALMQGGACIRIVPENDPSFSSHTFSAPVVALIAAATTPTEQAGDVGQAWRVKPLVWHNFDAWTWWAESTSGTYRVEERNGVWRATLNLPMTEHIIYEYQTDDITRDDFEAAHLACQSDHEGRIIAAIEPTSTTDELERLRSAIEALGAMPEGYCFCSKDRIGDDSKTHEPECADLREALKGGA